MPEVPKVGKRELLDKVMKKFNSFQKQDEDDVAYWRGLTGSKKLEILEHIRAMDWLSRNEEPGRLQRVYHIIK